MRRVRQRAGACGSVHGIYVALLPGDEVTSGYQEHFMSRVNSVLAIACIPCTIAAAAAAEDKYFY
jgi:hypothetical protein